MNEEDLGEGGGAVGTAIIRDGKEKDRFSENKTTTTTKEQEQQEGRGVGGGGCETTKKKRTTKIHRQKE